MITVKCAWCGTEKEVPECRLKRQKNFFCNAEHNYLYKSFSQGTREIECAFCGKKVIKTQSELAKVKGEHYFCSRQCAANFKKKRVIFSCDWCGKSIEYPECHADRAEKHFCDAKCAAEWRSANIKGKQHPAYSRVTTHCHICGKEVVKKNSHFNRTKRHFCSEGCRGAFYTTDENKNEQRIRTLKILSTYPRRTKPELMMRKCLKDMGVEFQEQVVIGNKFCVDFYIPNNTVIEVFGDYFHANPEVYGEEKKPIDKMQKRNMANDIRRLNYLRKCNYKVLVVWEKDIYERMNEVRKLLEVSLREAV